MIYLKLLIAVPLLLAFLYLGLPTQDPSSHCAAMKSNPECRNYGDAKNCSCVREKGPDGKCPTEGAGCTNHCCRNKCRCHHPTCVEP